MIELRQKMTKEKTLSQQICELCGIKPKKVEKTSKSNGGHFDARG